MLRLSLVVILLTHSIRTAHVTEAPSVYDRIFQKLEKLTPKNRENELTQTEKLYEKLNRLDSLSPDINGVELSDENELISAMQSWLNPEQVGGVYKVIQGLKTERQDSDQEYGDNYWNDEDSEQGEEDYVMDGNDDWDELTSDLSSTSKPFILGIPEGVTPSAITKLGPSDVVSAAASILATKARPRILDDTDMTKSERIQLGSAVLRNTRFLIREGACLVPQPRWLTVKQLAPAADTAYTPPCVQLHRCAHDSGCCTNESHVCAPIEGKNVIFPFYLHKAGGIMSVVKMQFYNHTKCGCVSRERLESTIAIRRSMGIRIGSPSFSDIQEEETPLQREMERQNDWRVPTVGLLPGKEDEDTTAPPQLRRCTCPRLFLANMTSNSPCSCVCGWPDISKRRDCLHLAKGKEHFGITDRVCIKRGDCTAPTCEYGAYDRETGKCPVRKYRRYHARGRF